MQFSNYTVSLKGFFVPSYEVHKNDELVYTLHRPSFFKFRTMHLCDVDGNLQMIIRQHFKLASYKYDLIEEDQITAQIGKSLLSRQLTSESRYGNYDIKTEGLNSAYTIIKGGVQEVAKISRKRFRRKNCYGISIKEGENELYIIAIVLIISLINRLRKKRS